MALPGISLIIGFVAIKLIETLDKNQNEKMEKLSGIIVPLIAAIYFIYQATSGSFFATTSITLEAKRNTDNANEVVITANIERGDNCLVEILESKYQITEHPGNRTSDWKSIAFPSRIEGSTAILRLALKEKTQTRRIQNRSATPQTPVRYAHGIHLKTLSTASARVQEFLCKRSLGRKLPLL
ncbi:hypothetical protein ACH50O_05110 [Methylomonas sp. 2BW1-5-20]|uniref:hypothetical protein n=1 Tax=Methylomonas sp. 2BW1-5-20 TaxID=3376686 RepID=UPI00405202FD